MAVPPPADLRLVEVHPQVHGAAGVTAIFDAMSAQGFGYCPAGSKAATVVFERV